MKLPCMYWESLETVIWLYQILESGSSFNFTCARVNGPICTIQILKATIVSNIT